MADTEQIVEHVQDLVARTVLGRRVVVVCAVLAGATTRVEALRQQGAGEILVIGLSVGTGERPGGDGVTCVECDSPPIRSVADEIAVWQAYVDKPPPEALDALTIFDPAHEAAVLCLLPVTLESYAGRETWGGRPPAFTALEDKTLSEQIWRDSDVPHSPEVVVPVDREALHDSASRLDKGQGTVWSADASDGMNGGSDRVFWVRDDQGARAAYDNLRLYAKRARLMPFLQGVPCSIHGLVLPDGVVVLRPVELLVLRRPGSLKFVYAGISTAWDPRPDDREAMREVARRVGTYLAREHDYRGAFGIDGVLTADGFRPHELNPRFSGGISAIGKGLPDLPLNRVHDLALRGVDLGVTAPDLEDVLLQAADASRFGSAYLVSHDVNPTETTQIDVSGSAHQLSVTFEPEHAVGTLELGPHLAGGLIRYQPKELAPGTRLAPWGVAALALADQLWDTRIGHLATAPDVRR
ncbi:hypothetical protein [Luteipulveratus mongoliensis]|uniref:ATP-grasp domain-containing protein n=1 Tax=Luteipulveratus mongoliensis TaxID=571913 RepID=A0A0K1JI76_9MICO|nr:hypothetical protein [Luteipulveratus mongoliensis]AKU16424.1 hypothetical protein VV02_12035 [Luteipulveratus mongoliensis]